MYKSRSTNNWLLLSSIEKKVYTLWLYEPFGPYQISYIAAIDHDALALGKSCLAESKLSFHAPFSCGWYKVEWDMWITLKHTTLKNFNIWNLKLGPRSHRILFVQQLGCNTCVQKTLAVVTAVWCGHHDGKLWKVVYKHQCVMISRVCPYLKTNMV